MKHFIYLSAICMVVLSSCTGSFKKGGSGLEYKIIASGSGKSIGYGDYMQIHIKQVYGGTKDTVLMDTRDIMPRIQLFDSVNTPLSYYKILSQLRKGDSCIIRLLTDTAFKSAPQEMPPYMKKGKYLYTSVKMVNFFSTKAEADSANLAERKLAKPRYFQRQITEIEKDLATKSAQLEIDSKIIEDYLTKNNIKATKTKWGTYVVITTEGTGEKINNTQIVSVNYTGRSLDSGIVFDSNIDPKFNHTQPYDVNMGEFGSVILGWNDAFFQLKKGSKATIYIPSVLAYGVQGKGAEIKPNENLVFDVEIVDAATEDEYAAKQSAQQEEMMKKMQESQKQSADSLKKSGK